MDFLKDRGLPWEFDPGPPANRQWARLFAETPNYRGLGRASAAVKSSAGTSARCSIAAG